MVCAVVKLGWVGSELCGRTFNRDNGLGEEDDINFGHGDKLW